MGDGHIAQVVGEFGLTRRITGEVEQFRHTGRGRPVGGGRLVGRGIDTGAKHLAHRVHHHGFAVAVGRKGQGDDGKAQQAIGGKLRRHGAVGVGAVEGDVDVVERPVIDGDRQAVVPHQ